MTPLTHSCPPGSAANEVSHHPSEAAFWERQKQLPHGPERPEYRPIPVWRIVGGFVLAAALVVIVISVARAAEPRVWQIWDVSADRAYHPHKFTSPTACNTDIAGIKDGSGRRLACVKIVKTNGE